MHDEVGLRDNISRGVDVELLRLPRRGIRLRFRGRFVLFFPFCIFVNW
jgi:hypothetical protein